MQSDPLIAPRLDMSLGDIARLTESRSAKALWGVASPIDRKGVLNGR